MNIKLPMEYENKGKWILSLILQERLGLPVIFEKSQDGLLSLQYAGHRLTLPAFFSFLKNKNGMESILPPVPLQMWDISTSGLDAKLADRIVPVLFGKPGFHIDANNNGHLELDIFGSVFFMLSRYEEAVSNSFDQHQRFSAAESIAVQAGFLDRPLADEYIEILWAAIKRIWPDLHRKPKKFAVKLSHDIDIVQRYPDLHHFGRAFAADIIKHRDWRQALTSFMVFAEAKNDPYVQGIFRLAALSERHGFTSAFYFMGAETASQFDAGYDPEAPIVKSCIQELRDRGHEIGFHPSYAAFDSPEKFKREKERITAILGHGHFGGRHHYLRFRAPGTWRLWEENGMMYDSTLSYAEHEGFRCGTCHPFRPYDLHEDREINLLEIPLIVMDGTLKQYRKLTPEEGEERILTLAKRCKQVNGVFTMLWHNTSLQADWKPWGAMYSRLLPQLSEMQEF